MPASVAECFGLCLPGRQCVGLLLAHITQRDNIARSHTLAEALFSSRTSCIEFIPCLNYFSRSAQNPAALYRVSSIQDFLQKPVISSEVAPS